MKRGKLNVKYLMQMKLWKNGFIVYWHDMTSYWLTDSLSYRGYPFVWKCTHFYYSVVFITWFHWLYMISNKIQDQQTYLVSHTFVEGGMVLVAYEESNEKGKLC